MGCMNPSPAPRSPISEAIAFLVTARNYRFGAYAILTNAGLRAQWETDRRFALPAVMLIAHAIELYLKAWLSEKGVTTQELRRRPYGHDLTTLFAEAKTRGLIEPARPPQQSFQDMIESFAEHHGDYSFRYPDSGWTYNVPQMDIVFDVLNDFDAQISAAVLGTPETVNVANSDNLRLPVD